jgi:hypothetical protein
MQLENVLDTDLDNQDPFFLESSCKLVPLNLACGTYSRAEKIWIFKKQKFVKRKLFYNWKPVD